MSVRIFGQHDEATVQQIHRCMAVGGARAVLCADGHKGYAHPIGGVIAYRDLVSISGVGFDIACGNLAIRTNKTGAEIRPKIAEIMDEVVRTISFGMGRHSKQHVEHDLFDDPLWAEQPFAHLKPMAEAQLGTVGSGNHYVDIFVDEADHRHRRTMDDILNRPIVLVLNRNWQAINVRTPQQAFVQMATDVATALDIDGENMVPARWAEWIKLPVRENDYAVRTPSGPIRVPAVIVLSRFAKVPKRRPKFSARAIWARDGGQCQYTGANLRPSEGNIDHVLPRSRGGKTSWEMREIARASQIEIKTEIAPDLPEVSIDLQRMDYVITNLITNAIKYSPKGTEILVRMGLGKLRTTEPGVRFSVTDQGPGIPMDYQEHIFERFYRVPGTKKSGAGLGLSIAREVVVMHQGEIGVISQVGIGSEFFFILPSISGQVSEAASVEKNDA